ncbi:MAG: 16S rRNA (uracil(1498)-N(3))-methyltransferase [Thiomonas sp.]|uniref:16S rRNA (uracil(1498)-N(3))-methyltransferase n=1 Tax=Thiomonas sp. TaxID=2047785 RepID=UPI002A35DEC5|nr:16S rRNA (uracil(1498)-N(3))-methyltransferase [Thiomonas sp.]MDY0330670.1 16S rRNA (uracil(1498)-N(3))-methyltransferase [Thiomonas sp.]
MLPRLFIPSALRVGLFDLPAAASRHVQVLRLRAGENLVLFDGLGGEWLARLQGAQQVEVLEYRAIERETGPRIHLAIGMPANERMDWLVEKATELGAASLQPLITQRSVLRLSGERAQRRVMHWQGIAAGACEQCGRNRLPRIAPIRHLADWLDDLPSNTARLLLSPQADSASLLPALAAGDQAHVLSGPEGGLSADEEALALAAGFTRATLGPRVLRADTAPLCALVQLTFESHSRHEQRA